MFFLLDFAYRCMAWHIPPPMPFSTISSMSTSVSNSSSTSVFRHACHANPGPDKKYAGSSSYTSMNFLQKLSNTSANSSYDSLPKDHNTSLGFVF